MTRTWLTAVSSALVCNAAVAIVARADHGTGRTKLGPIIRATLAELELGAAAEALRAKGRPLDDRGRLDVFVLGELSR